MAIGEHLYHGSRTGEICTLEPRQAKNHGRPDGEPAVFATPRIDYAIFMALIGSRSWGGWNKKYPGDGFYIYEEFVDYLTSDEYDIEGHVYFVPRSEFSMVDGQHRSFGEVSTLDSIIVSALDLPAGISILPELHPARLRAH